MEEHHGIGMREIAEIYYETSTPSTDLQQLARDFFKSIDYNDDGKVSLCEFLNYMKENGFINMGNRPVFEALDVNRKGSLEFMEVMALYYIIKSGRPFCGGCGNFIPGMFFSCSICFDNEDDTFSVCPMCFRNGNKSYIHKHKPIHFLDNFALLEAKRKKAMATRKAPPPTEAPPSKRRKIKSLIDRVIPHGRATPAYATRSSTSASASKAIVPHKPEQKECNQRGMLFELGLNMIGSVAGNVASAVAGPAAVAAAVAVAGGCNIM